MKKTITLLSFAIAVFVFPLLGGAGVGLAQTINTFAGTGVSGFSGDGGTATAIKNKLIW